MLHPLTGCYSFFGRNRQRPQNHRTLANLVFPSVCQHLSQSRTVTPCLLLKVIYLKSIIVTHSLPGKVTHSLSLKVAGSLLKVTHSLSLKVTHSLPGKATHSLSLKVAGSLLKVAYSLSLKVIPQQHRKVAHCLPLTRRFHWQ